MPCGCFGNLFRTKETWCRLHAIQVSRVRHAFYHPWISSNESTSIILLFLVTCTTLPIGILKGSVSRHSQVLVTFHRLRIDLHCKLGIQPYLCMCPLRPTHIHSCKRVCSRSCGRFSPRAHLHGTCWKIENLVEAICIYIFMYL